MCVDDGDQGSRRLDLRRASKYEAPQGDAASAAGWVGSVATWEFTGLVPGTYHVAAAWFAANRASNSPFTVRETIGGAELDTVLVNRKSHPMTSTATEPTGRIDV
ncbi:MAG: hypothetical protein R3C02_20040 [Planctomycetaceae bacterium]